jgi:hypothetical protein
MDYSSIVIGKKYKNLRKGGKHGDRFRGLGYRGPSKNKNKWQVIYLFSDPF